MPCSEEKSASFGQKILFAVYVVCCAVTLSGLAAVSNVSAQSSSVNATICASSSSVTITQPVSDSVVTDATITLKGMVSQASQIEVMIDAVYDGVIPLDTDQTTFEGQIQLSAGTHTITLKAIDYCQTADSVATTVITYTPPPGSSSIGSQTDTVTGDTGAQGVVIQDQGDDDPKATQNFLLPAIILEPLKDILRWLNIASYDTHAEPYAQLSLARAIAIGVGAYLAVFGMVGTVATAATTLPALRAFPASRRLKIVGRFFRIVGLVVVIAGLFL